MSSRKRIDLSKIADSISIDLRKFARGKECQVRIPGYCNRDTATTVWAHLRHGGVAGAGQKPPDLCGVIACSTCHDIIDGRINCEWTRQEIGCMERDAICRTMALVWKTFF